MSNKLEGKVAVVSGSGRGIGREIALKLAADSVTQEIIAAGGRAVSCVGNVTAPAFAARFINTALSTYGRLDIIVNNAGYTWDNVIQKMSDEQWDAIMDVHVTAPFRILRAASEYFRRAAKEEAEQGQ